MKTRFRPRGSLELAAWGALGPPKPISSPRSENSSESGRMGPGPLTDQKLVRLVSQATIRSGRMPSLPRAGLPLVLAEAELGIAAKTVTQNLSRSSCMWSKTNSATSIAPSLKYSPNEKDEHLEEGQVEGVEPDLVDVGRAKDLLDSRERGAPVRAQAQEVGHQRLHARAVEQRRVIPGRAGRARPEGWSLWPFDSKNARKPSRSSAVVRMRADCTSRTFGTAV